MSRIVSVWLRAWPIARLLNAQASVAPSEGATSSARLRHDRYRPLVLVAPGKGGARIVALNRAARDGGVRQGELLSNARSKVLDLQSAAADPAADAAALRKLALWCVRYTPVVAPWGEESGGDGLFLDITGAAHLFGGEAALLADLERRLRAFGLFPRLGLAGTAGASWAIARHGAAGDRIVPPGEEVRALRGLPLAGLRLSGEAQALMRRLGFREIGELIEQPRAPFAARFGPELLARLDQALGRAPEPLVPVMEPPVYRVQATFLEPILSQEHVLEAARHLLRQLTETLERDAVGARVLRLLLFRVDSQAQSLDIGLAASSRDPEHIGRLMALRLDRLGDCGLDAELGYEAAAVHVLAAEPLCDRQERLGMDGEGAAPEALSQLIDRLQQRLGAGAVCRLQPRQSHIPERAVYAASPSPRKRGEGHCGTVPSARGEGRRQTPVCAPVAAPHPNPLPTEEWGEGALAPRPLLLLPAPEAADVIALIPEGPPRQFRWRGVLHHVVEAQGPERIGPEWWRRTDKATRDYYMVEDAAGRRFWLYRDGLYDRGEPTPQWFVHGVFG